MNWKRGTSEQLPSRQSPVPRAVSLLRGDVEMRRFFLARHRSSSFDRSPDRAAIRETSPSPPATPPLLAIVAPDGEVMVGTHLDPEDRPRKAAAPERNADTQDEDEPVQGPLTFYEQYMEDDRIRRLEIMGMIVAVLEMREREEREERREREMGRYSA